MPVAILKKVPVAGQKSARGNSKIAQNARAMAKLHVANLKKVPVHPQKMPVANYEGKFATGIKKCHGEKKNTVTLTVRSIHKIIHIIKVFTNILMGFKI